MARYIDADEITRRIVYYHGHTPEGCGERYAFGIALKLINQTSTADVVEVVRCKDCIYNGIGSCKHRADYFCATGTPKERGADKPKITCLNCKHLVFSDMYGECNKQLRIVNPSDTCEYAEPKERGGEK